MIAGQLSREPDKVFLDLQPVRTVAKEGGQTGSHAKATAPFAECPSGRKILLGEKDQDAVEENRIAGKEARDPAVAIGVEEMIESAFRLLDQGGTYDIGQSLPQLICKHDMEIVSIEPIYRIARPGIKIWEWFILFTESYMPKLIEKDT